MGFVDDNFNIIFENELKNIYTDETLWPSDRTLKMFKEWFDVEYHSPVFDTVEEPIRKLDIINILLYNQSRNAD